jgi:hypothetical protein
MLTLAPLVRSKFHFNNGQPPKDETSTRLQMMSVILWAMEPMFAVRTCRIQQV